MNRINTTSGFRRMRCHFAGLRMALLLASVLVLGAPAFGATNDATAALQKGLFEEEANHDYNAAIGAYQAVIRQFDQDRKLAATAVFRLGECYRKQGDTNAANAQYQRVLREFPDQTPLVTLSRSYLAAAGETPASASAAAPATSEEAEEVRRIKAMIKDSPDLINARDGLGQTPLHRAADKGQLVVATFLLDNGAQVDATDKSGQTPLHLATLQGHKSMMELLLAHHANVQAERSDSEAPTALHIAAQRGFRSLLELLLEHKADVNAKGPTGVTPLHLAAVKGFKAIAEVLLHHGAEVNAIAAPVVSSFRNPQPIRASNGSVIRGTPLDIAARRGDEPLAELLLANKADPNIKLDDGTTPLHLAARSGQDAIAKLLIEHGAEVNARTKDGLTPLAYAAENGSLALARVLLDAKADPNIPFSWGAPSQPGAIPPQYPPLSAAVVNKRGPDMVKLLIEGGANPNAAVEGSGAPVDQTALLEAVSTQQKQVVAILLNGKADSNVPNYSGNSPLHEAISQPEVEEMLLAAKAVVNATNNSGETPLHWAAGAGLKPSAEMLLAHGADINARDDDGDTPLHFAVLAGRKEMVDFLLAQGANPNLPNNEGNTPLNWVKSGSAGIFANWIQLPNNASFLRRTSPRPVPGQPGAFTLPPALARNSIQPAVPNATRQQMAEALRDHGAVDALPHFDRIEVGRPGSNHSAPIFHKGTNDWNHFTVLDALGVEYHLLTGNPAGEPRRQAGKDIWATSQKLWFPNLAQLRIRQPEADLKTWHERKVDLTPVFESGDGTKDQPLAWGDVLEVPETDHPLNEQWKGFTDVELTNFVKCLSRTVEVVIKGRTNQLILGPELSRPTFAGYGAGAAPKMQPTIMTGAPLWLEPALRHSNLLLASSDLSRVKVTRRDPATGQTHEWVLDCSDNKPAPAFWLENGDMIEVPEKP